MKTLVVALFALLYSVSGACGGTHVLLLDQSRSIIEKFDASGITREVFLKAVIYEVLADAAWDAAHISLSVIPWNSSLNPPLAEHVQLRKDTGIAIAGRISAMRPERSTYTGGALSDFRVRRKDHVGCVALTILTDDYPDDGPHFNEELRWYLSRGISVHVLLLKHATSGAAWRYFVGVGRSVARENLLNLYSIRALTAENLRSRLREPVSCLLS